MRRFFPQIASFSQTRSFFPHSYAPDYTATDGKLKFQTAPFRMVAAIWHNLQNTATAPNQEQGVSAFSVMISH